MTDDGTGPSKRQRTAYTSAQLVELEKEFHFNRYVTSYQLAMKIILSQDGLFGPLQSIFGIMVVGWVLYVLAISVEIIIELSVLLGHSCLYKNETGNHKKDIRVRQFPLYLCHLY